jgi:hypothetical protein
MVGLSLVDWKAVGRTASLSIGKHPPAIVATAPFQSAIDNRQSAITVPTR